MNKNENFKYENQADDILIDKNRIWNHFYQCRENVNN